MCLICCWASTAPPRPASASWSILVVLARASENSAATKKPLRSTRRSAPTIWAAFVTGPRLCPRFRLYPRASPSPLQDQPHHPVPQRRVAPVPRVAPRPHASLHHARAAGGAQVVPRLLRVEHVRRVRVARPQGPADVVARAVEVHPRSRD